ncbi:MAG: leucine-rich repeat domain-containing protein, partial [Bacteroidetes bacterium]|nr:leucine-rich repeat domain-containing protein [Bacteroidota bacterium]
EFFYSNIKANKMTKKHFNLISGKKDLTNNTSSYTHICSAITTSNVAETTIRGGVTTTSRVVVLLHILIICAFTTANLSAQPITITSLTQNGSTAGGCLINGGPTTGASITGSIIIADGLGIPDFAFMNNTNITSVTAAGSIGTIGNNAFWNSSGTITFNNVTTISSDAFRGSSGDITFNDVTTIGNFAFTNSLGNITFHNVGTINGDAFSNSLGNITFHNVGTINIMAFLQSSGDITFNDVGTIQGGAFLASTSQIYVPHNTTDAKIQEFASAGYTKTIIKLPPPTYTLTITSAGNGSVEVDGTPYTTTLTFDEDDNVVVEFLPDAKHQIKSVIVNGTPASRSRTYTINSIAKNYNISVEFEEKPPARINKVVVKKGRLIIKPIP